MSESVKSNVTAPAEDARARPKRPYHKPVVRYERVFETQALACGKASGTQFSCRNSRKAS